MNFIINRNTLKKMITEQGHTQLEYALMRLSLGLYEQIAHNNEDYSILKQSIVAIYNKIPAFIEISAKKHKEKSATNGGEYRTQEQIIEAAKEMFPMMNPPYKVEDNAELGRTDRSTNCDTRANTDKDA